MLGRPELGTCYSPQPPLHCQREFDVYEGCENNDELSGRWWEPREICKWLGAIGEAFDDGEDRREGAV
ncbi:hypothetical protein J1N35_018805 [Gossypium stocksii]|uniref:Uncharacterized protein n=1 Tax=Gossypium stocksii TaxID=47602 RepID=A0A9D3VRW5_9ROSI|nr:hypothetical protein J1N35_018805 [Gossypium stocksii]